MGLLGLDAPDVFCGLVREGGVVHAAAELHRAPSSVAARVVDAPREVDNAKAEAPGRALPRGP